MKKVVIKEFDRTLLGIDLMLYCFFVVIGYIMLQIPEISVLRPIEYASPLFYMFAFMSLVAYFVNRRSDDYEFLFFGLINVVVGTYVLVNEYFTDSCFIIGNAVLLYALANVLNKGYNTKILMEQCDVNFYVKLSITVLLTLLSLLVLSDLFNSETVSGMVLGYYFMGFGLISLFEPLLMIITKNPQVETYLVSLNENEKTKTKEKKTTKKTAIKEIKKKKPVKKSSEKTTSKKEE